MSSLPSYICNVPTSFGDLRITHRVKENVMCIILKSNNKFYTYQLYSKIIRLDSEDYYNTLQDAFTTKIKYNSKISYDPTEKCYHLEISKNNGTNNIYFILVLRPYKRNDIIEYIDFDVYNWKIEHPSSVIENIIAIILLTLMLLFLYSMFVF